MKLFIAALSAAVLFGTTTFASNHQPMSNDVTVGEFTAADIEITVVEFLSAVGWDEETEYEDTGYKMKDLLLQLAKKEVEAYDWLIEVTTYLNSEEFQNQDDNTKASDLFQAKVYVKMAIFQQILIPAELND